MLEGARIGREHIELVGTGVVDVAGAVRLGGQRAVDLPHRLCELVIAASSKKSLNPRELRRAGVGPVGLERTQARQ
jgi:hypothetical protein